MSLEMLLPLDMLRPGEWAEVRDVAGEPSWVARLAELGVRAGIRLQILQPGPPSIVLVGGSRLSLRGDDTVQVLVQPVPASRELVS